MTTSIYTIDDKIWNTYARQKYAVNNLLVLGFKTVKTIEYAGSKFDSVEGLSVDPRKSNMEIKRAKQSPININIGSPDKVLIEDKGSNTVQITIL